MNATKILPLNLDHRMFTEVHHGIQQTLSNMFGVDPRPMTFSIGKFTKTGGDISAVLNLVQEKAVGILIVSFPRATILPIFSRLYQDQFEDFNQSIEDGIGEIANVTFGIMKASMNRAGYSLSRAIPEIVVGSYRPVTKVPLTTMTIPYTSQYGAFEVQVVVYDPNL